MTEATKAGRSAIDGKAFEIERQRICRGYHEIVAPGGVIDCCSRRAKKRQPINAGDVQVVGAGTRNTNGARFVRVQTSKEIAQR